MKTKARSSSNHRPNQKEYSQKVVKKKKAKRKGVEDYIILHGNIYQANTHSERDKYIGFIQNYKVKTSINANTQNMGKMQKTIDNHGFTKSEKKQTKIKNEKNHDLQSYVKSLNQKQKEQIIKKLEKQINVNPQLKEMNLEQTSSSSIVKIQEKLNSIKKQISTKKQQEINLVEKQFSQKKISKYERKTKLFLISKISEEKNKIVECTKALFQKILGNQSKNHLEFSQILKNLNSLSSLDKLPLESQTSRHIVSQSSLSCERSNNAQICDDEIRIQEEEKKLTFDKVEQSKLNELELKIPQQIRSQGSEQINIEQRMKQLYKAKELIEKRISYQMSEYETDEGFTTLAGINNYIIQIYEYTIRFNLDMVIDKFNFPYGKRVREKLSLLQADKNVENLDMIDVLDSQLFFEFNRHIQQHIKFPQYEKIHQRAVYDCFKSYLNAYRPYFEMDGQIYPWASSEKGMTFYEINQESIEEVFEKTKIRVLETASFLCGLIVEECQSSICEGMLKDKRAEFDNKLEKIGIIEKYEDWKISLLNEETIIRIMISKLVFEEEIKTMAEEFLR